jgi:hypothetical protein
VLHNNDGYRVAQPILPVFFIEHGEPAQLAVGWVERSDTHQSSTINQNKPG